VGAESIPLLRIVLHFFIHRHLCFFFDRYFSLIVVIPLRVICFFMLVTVRYMHLRCIDRTGDAQKSVNVLYAVCDGKCLMPYLIPALAFPSSHFVCDFNFDISPYKVLYLSLVTDHGGD